MAFLCWRVREPEPGAVAELVSAGCPPLLAKLLVNRGYGEAGLARSFLRGGQAPGDPLALQGMEEAAARIRTAVARGEKIVVYGDYDVDGVTATALLLTRLRALGADVSHYIPEREGEGYGLNAGAVQALSQRGASLIVTVDTGISAAAEAELIAQLGMELVVTDHHEPREILPRAAAVVDPKLPGCGGFRELSGVGVAGKLACALTGGELSEEEAALAALGTVADVVPLTGENRALVRRGLACIQKGASPGISALLETAGAGELSATTLAFLAAPRINAAGRMASAADALGLLLARSREEALPFARTLDELNRQRQQTEKDIFDQAVSAVGPQGAADPVLTVAGENWHPGVIGIVASRLAELYERPVVMVSFEGDVGRGSCRSFPGYDIHTALTGCGDLLERFGGHELAAGFTVRRQNWPPLCAALQAFARSLPEMPAPALELECALAPEEITLDSAKLCARLEPCGAGNPEPLFLIPGARVDAVTPLKEGRHLRLSVRCGSAVFTALCFNAARLGFAPAAGERLDLAASLSVNRYRGQENLSVLVRAARPCCVFDQTRRLLVSPGSGGAPLPGREDFAAVFRLMRGADRLNLAQAAQSLDTAGGFSTEKLLIALEVFSELELMTLSPDGDTVAFVINPDKKINLGESRLLRRLTEAAAGRQK